jgi:hypothetical protein
MSEFPQINWLRAFRRRVNADPEMGVVGEWFTTALSLSFGESRYILCVERGKVTEVSAARRLDQPCAFGFRAPVSAWKKFLSPSPPPLYHDFFAMLMRAPEFVLEGDSLAAMQNARALHRMMNLMRHA